MHSLQVLTSLLVTATGLAAGSGQSPSTDQIGSVHCRVISDIRDEAVNRARVTLYGGRLAEPITAYSDERGGSTFQGIPAGQYSLGIEKAGYFPLTGAKAIPVEVEAGSRAEMGEQVLVAMRSIEGSVSWATGDPADRVIVHALMIRRGAAVFWPGDARLVMTNARGEYRLEGLMPGRYVVFSYVLGLAEAGMRPKVAPPVYYPGQPEPSAGNAIDLRKSAEATGIKMILTEAAGVRVSGVVEPSASVPEGTSIFVGMQLNGSPAQPIAGTRTKAGAPFQIEGVPPGAYTMIIVPESRLDARSFYPLEVGNIPVTDLVIPFAEPKRIECDVKYRSGTIEHGSANSVTDSGHGPKCPEIRLLAQSDRLGLAGVMVSSADEKCQTRFEGAAPGETYHLRVLRAPTDAYVAMIRQAQRGLGGDPLSVTEGAGRVEIILKDDGATIHGRLITERKPSGGFVVLAPKDRAQPHLYRTAEVKRDGTFQLTAVAPGEYRAYALESNEEDAYLDEDYLRKYDKRATPLMVGSASTLKVALELP